MRLKVRTLSWLSFLGVFGYFGFHLGDLVVGEMFNINRNATYWYEPVDSFYSFYHGLQRESLPLDTLYWKNGTARSTTGDERERLVGHLSDVFTCDYRKLPTEALLHVFVRQSREMAGYWECVAGGGTENVTRIKWQFDVCKQHLRVYCANNVDHSIRNNCHVTLEAARALIDSGFRDFGDPRALSTARERSGLVRVASGDKMREFLNHVTCMRNWRADKIERCLSDLLARCRSKRLHVAKVVRIRMTDVRYVIDRIPDLHVIYFVRDPRAIVNSRIRSRKLTWNKTNRERAREASVFCPRMFDDVMILNSTMADYPGAVHVIKYEDFVDDPLGVIKKVYSFLDMLPPSEWSEYYKSIMYSPDGAAGGGFGVKVKDARKVVGAWKRDMRKKDIINVNKQCSNLISALGYEM